VLLLLVACHRLPDAPEDLDALMSYIYGHTADEEPDALEAASGNLSAWLDLHLQDTLTGYAIQDLDAETVAALDAGSPDLDDLVGAAVGHESPWPAETVGLEASVAPGTDLENWGTEGEGKVYRSDPACFAAQTCDWLEAEEWTSDEVALGIVADTHWWRQWRWLHLESGTGMVERQWTLEPATFNVSFLQMDAQYYTWIFLPVEDGTSVSVQATWIVARLTGAPVPEALAMKLVTDHMIDMGTRMDERVTE
jgi:hypothetical protein